MNTKTKILMVEHDPNDIELIQRELKKGKVNYTAEIVETGEAYKEALLSFEPDIILSDYALPSFDGPTAFKLREELSPDTPFIFVSGTIGEENSIELIKNGVTDYALKDKLFTLTTKVKRALKEAKEKQQHQKTEEEIVASEQRYHSLFDNMLEGFSYCKMIYENGKPTDFIYLDVNNAFEKLTGLKDVTGRKVTELIPHIKEDNPALFEAYSRVSLTGKPERFEVYIKSIEMWLDISVYSNAKEYFTAVFDVITTRKKAEEDLVQSEMYLRTIIENNADGIVLLNDELQVTYISPNCKTLLGYEPEELMGNFRIELIHPDDVGFLMETYARVLQDSTYKGSVRYRFMHKDGHYVWTAGNSSNQLSNPAIKAIILNYRDITNNKKIEDEIIQLNNKLEERVRERTTELTEANKALEAFSYSVSHDLRSPVRSVIGFSTLIQKEYSSHFSPELKELFEHIKSSSNRMSAIIDDLLTLAKYGKEKLKLSRIDMNALVHKVWDDIRFTSPHHATLEMELLPEVEADISMMEQVFVNLLSNAVKYSSKKEKPVIKVGCEDAEGATIFFVEDNGVGFDMKYYGRLFGAFQRLHGVSEFEGTGVGLLLVKMIIEKHLGTVWAESKINEGATFYFSLSNKTASAI